MQLICSLIVIVYYYYETIYGKEKRYNINNLFTDNLNMYTYSNYLN